LKQAAAPETSTPEAGHEPRPHGKLALSLATLGVVYGDIGTSPLYALRECFHDRHEVALNTANILGVLSLIFWALTIVISIKYLVYVMRADNRGEGGVLALMALAASSPSNRRWRWLLVMLGLFGAALLYGDGMITPAISVLSAVEGLEVAAPGLDHFVIPITIGILVVLFLFQRHGTARVGTVFGPIMIVWFSILALLGVSQIVTNPGVLRALSPTYAIVFMIHNQLDGLMVLGAVFLVVTGGEALYADMGHFGLPPIRWTWFSVVLPALLLNYFGQGALLLRHPETVSNPFYQMAPTWALIPLLVLATCATVIASQAVISGAFSLTRQAAMLGYWPRVRILHTSAHEIGQIYVPLINWGLMVATISLVLGFGSSSNLAAAYGIAVTTTMVITTILAYEIARHRWGWSVPAAGGLTALFLMIDLSFFGANLFKIEQGGWLPLVIAAAVFIVMTTWKKGRELLGRNIRERLVPLEDFFEIMRIGPMTRVPGTAVFMTSSPNGTPPALMQLFLHSHAIHDQVILLTITIEESARVPESERLTV